MTKKPSGTFLRRTALSLIAGLISCGQPSGTGDQPRYGGTLVYVKNSPPVTMDPALATETESTIPCDNVFETLVQLSLGSEVLKPGLARSWDISEDRLQYTFHLRTGVRFHDDTPFNADAVLFAFNRQVNPERHFRPDAFSFWKNFAMDRIIRKTEALNDSTVVITLHAVNATFMQLLSMMFTAIPSPTAVRTLGPEFERQPVGTGPFRFAAWSQADHLVLVANTDYWNGRPYLDTIIFKANIDMDDRVNRLISGSYDMIEAPPQNRIKELEANPGIKLLKQPGVNIAYMAMNLNKRPFNDERVRRAVVYAIDRKKLVDEVYGPLGSPLKNPIPPMLIGYNDEIPDTPFDPAKSRELLAEAGFPDGFKTSLWVMSIPREYIPDPKRAAELIRRDLHEVGIAVSVRSFDWIEYLDRSNSGDHEMAISGWIADIPDPDNFFHPLLDKTVADQMPSNNIAFYRGEEMHRLLLDGKKESDLVRRDAIYKQACVVFNRDLPWFMIGHSVVILPMKSRVMNFTPYSSYARRFNNVWLNPNQQGEVR